MNRPILIVTISMLLGTSLCAATMWHDHKSLRLLCYWKTVHSEKEARDTTFPPSNRQDAAYEYQEIMKQPDISAHMFIQVAPEAKLTVESLLQDDGQDLALVTTRLGLPATGFGDNHDLRRNTSGQNYVQIKASGPNEKSTYVSYSCGVYELPLPAQPRLAPGSTPRLPPIH